MRRIVIGIVTAAGCVLALTALGGRRSSMRWEYFIGDAKTLGRQWRATIDSLGREGWELVTFSQTGNEPMTIGIYSVWIFKRPLPFR